MLELFRVGERSGLPVSTIPLTHAKFAIKNREVCSLGFR